MIYMINYESDYQDGCSAQFYTILGNHKLGFKEYHSKKRALYAYSVQKKLAKFGLAPKVFGRVRRVSAINYDEIIRSNWGYVTEKTPIVGDSYSMREIQCLVDNIKLKTGLDFWDCHEYNIGVRKIGKKKKLVCIDTGKESFDPGCNAWGNTNPGPKCSVCKRYSCKCEEDY